MKEITVSNDNHSLLFSAENGEEIIIGHVGTREKVKLVKIENFTKPKRMTLKEVELLLGFPIEIVSND